MGIETQLQGAGVPRGLRHMIQQSIDEPAAAMLGRNEESLHPPVGIVNATSASRSSRRAGRMSWFTPSSPMLAKGGGGRCRARPRFYSAGRPTTRLDAREPRRHNGEVRIRLVLIAVAFAVLALAGVRGVDSRAIEPHGPLGSDAACVVAAQPPADVDPPAIVRAAVTTPAAPQTHLDVEAPRHTRLVTDAGTVVRQARTQPDRRITSPRSFPLLI